MLQTKSMKVKIPKPEQLNLQQFNAIALLKQKDMSTVDVIQFVHSITGVDREVLERAEMKSLTELYAEILMIFNEFKVQEKPLDKITVKGRDYKLMKINNSLPATWFVMVQKYFSEGIQSHQVAALCYVEEGMVFNEQNPKAKREILNPLKDREQLFLKHMKAVDYLPLNAFFLKRFSELREPFLALQKARKIMRSKALSK